MIQRFKSHIWTFFLEKIISGYSLVIVVHTFHWKSSKFFFLIFRFPRSLQAKLAKMITHFTIQFPAKNLTRCTNLNSLDIEIDTWHMLRQHSQRTFRLCKYSSRQVSALCQKKTFALHYFLTPKSLHSWSTLIANVFTFLYISVTKLLFQRRSKVLFDGRGLRGGWITSLRWLAVWAS